MTNQKKCRSRDNHATGIVTAQEIERDIEDERMDNIARNGGDGEHYERCADLEESP